MRKTRLRPGFSFGSAGRWPAIPVNRRQQKTPPGPGFCLLPNPEGQGGNAGSGGLEGLDAVVQAALVASSLVLVDQATRAEAIQDRLGNGEGGFGAGGIVG